MMKSRLIMCVGALAAYICSCFSATAGQDLLYSVESAYNNIYVYRIDGYLHMRFSHNVRFYTESVYNPSDDMELPATYTRFSTMGLLYAPQPVRKVLVIGLGGGRTSWYMHKVLPDAEVTAVELDDDVKKIALKDFGIKEDNNFQITVDDGRKFLMKSQGKFDIIIVDAYRGPFVPFHLLTKEFFTLAKSRLSPGGILVQNIEPTTMLFPSAAKTISSVFDNIDYYDANGNVVAVAYDGAVAELQTLESKAKLLQGELNLRYKFDEMLPARKKYSVPEDAKLLTDDFAPVETLNSITLNNMKWD